MTVAMPTHYDGFQGNAVKIMMTEDPVGRRYRGPGSWKEDRLTLNAKTGKVKAEREIIGNRNEKIIVSIELRISSKEVSVLIDKILEPYRESYEILDIWVTGIKIYDEKGNKYLLLGGSIGEILKDLRIDLDHPFPDVTEVSVDKSSI